MTQEIETTVCFFDVCLNVDYHIEENDQKGERIVVDDLTLITTLEDFIEETGCRTSEREYNEILAALIDGIDEQGFIYSRIEEKIQIEYEED